MKLRALLLITAFLLAFLTPQDPSRQPTGIPDFTRHTGLTASATQGKNGLIVYGAGGYGSHPDLWTMNPDGSYAGRLTFTPHLLEMSPRWSPNGKHIAYFSCRLNSEKSCAGQRDIYVIRADGGGRKAITQTPSRFENALVWSPNGRYLYYMTDESALYRVNRDGRHRVLLHKGGEASGLSLDVSPNGRTLLYITTHGIYDKGALTTLNLQTRKQKEIGPRGEDVGPRYSRDGSHIVFVGEKRGVRGILMARADGSGRRLLLRSRLNKYHDYHGQHWTPDDKRILFLDIPFNMESEASFAALKTISLRDREPRTVTRVRVNNFDMQTCTAVAICRLTKRPNS